MTKQRQPESNQFAYYPGETVLYPGDITMVQETGDDETEETRVKILGQPQLELVIGAQVEKPLRTRYFGYFVRNDVLPTICNVDLELPDQPSTEDIARALIATKL